ncbi:ubiquitin carboxyl-terminal hydrolase 17-like [Punica granatum]|uniref:ubiquitinyl hydrolase 1 n=1 Tax=Punica granatum TaxID=22663 RepID=A0A6P8E0K4_PUNGR|nr:ubiquitin carboxyl-terminal hydrolase 17-like [Punica granatum]
MLIIGDLGFASLVLVVCLVLAAFALVVRRKWRASAARKEEIRRLLAMASEEAARAQLEDSVSCSAASLPSVSCPYQCAVCYFPTTTRCAKCKVVRYCSGKCQILHWRQGHREECRPPEEGTNFELKRAFLEEYVNHDGKCQNGVNKSTKLVELLPDEDTLLKSSSSAEELHTKCNDAKTAYGKGNTSPESSSASFSGFSASTTGSESSDDISVCESISSIDSGKCDEHISADTALGISEKDSNANIRDPVKPLSPKFASLVDSVGGFSSSGTLNQSKGDYDDGQVQCRSIKSSLSGNCTGNGTLTKESLVPDFWEGVVDSSGQRDRIENCSASSMSSGINTKDAFDSGSTLHFSFHLSQDNTPTVGKQVFEKASGDAFGAEKPHGVYVSPSVKAKDGVNATDFPSKKYERTRYGDEGSSNSSKNGAHFLKPREVSSSSFHSVHDSAGSSLKSGVVTGSMDAKSPGNSPSSTNGMTTHVSSNENRNLLRSHMVLSSTAPDKHAVSKSEDHSASHVKSRKAYETDKHVGFSSQATGGSLNSRNGLKMSVWRVIDQLKGSVISKHNQLGDPTDLDGKCNQKGLFSYELFIRLYMWKGVELRPCGLINCGNSCYANAVLQCLAFTPPLTSYFLQGLHRKTCRKREWCFSCEFEGLILKFKEGKSPVSPIGIVSQLKCIGSQLGHGREEDAHEFLRYAIDKMQSVCLMESGKKTFSSIEEETTLIGLIFGGYFRSKIKCTRCHGKSERHERMMDLTVEIEGDIGTLEEALRQFTRTETLDGENKYRCSRCKSYEKAKKKLTVLRAPNVLTIALKRFQSGKFGKLNKLVRFPESLDLTSFMSGTSDKPEYKLYGVIVHVDIMNAAFSGHYVCYVKDSRNKWFKIDDSTVTPVEIERVLSKGAYMLFYARSQPLDPRSLKNRAVPPVPVSKTLPVWNSGKDPTQRSQRSTNSYLTLDRSFYLNMHQLQRTGEDSSSDNSSLFSSYSDEGSCSTASTRDSTSFDDLSDYIFGDSSTLSSSPLYSRYSPIQTYEGSGGGGLVNLGGEGRGSVPFLHSDVMTKPRRDSNSSFSNMETDLGPLSVANQLFGDLKYNVVPSRRPRRGRTD